MAKNFETKFPKVENNLTGIWKYFLQDLFQTNCQNQLPKSHWPPDICIVGAWLSHLRGFWTKGETIIMKEKGTIRKEIFQKWTSQSNMHCSMIRITHSL